jgi:hypothetical protein
MTLLMLKFLPVQHLGYWLYDDDHWHVDFDHAAFVCDPISNPDEMRTLCSVVQGSTDINNFLYQTFCNIVSTSTDITLGTDREQLFRRLHKTRISQSIRGEFASL